MHYRHRVMVTFQHMKVKNMKYVFMTFFTPSHTVRADASSPDTVLIDDDLADTLRDLKFVPRCK
jgi:hypothetical protein